MGMPGYSYTLADELREVKEEKEMMEDVYIALAIGDGLKRKTDLGEEVVDDPIRSPLVRETMRIHAEARRKMFIVIDPKFPSAPNTLNDMRKYERLGIAIVKEQSQVGTGGAQREAICHPFREYDAKVVVHQEPEKVDVARRWIPYLVEPILKEGYQSVVPNRTESSWATYYEFQRRTESRANDIIARIRAETIQPYLDEMVGPTSFSREAESSVWEYRGTKWDAHMAPHDTIVAKGGKVTHILFDYQHPKSQVDAEAEDPSFLKKRVDQMVYCVNAILQHHFSLHPSLYDKRPDELKIFEDLAAQFPIYEDWNEFNSALLGK